MGVFEASMSFVVLALTMYITISQEQVLAEPAADIVFLVDGSQNMGAQGFKQVRTFILKTISRLNVGTDTYRIGLAQYSDVQHKEFEFDTFRTKKDVLNYIKRRFQYKGGVSLKTGIALDFLLKNFFTPLAESRKDKGIPQIAIIVTSAPSEDNVANYSTSLRNDNVIAISIGTKDSDLSELQTIAYRGDAPFVHRITNIAEISNLAPNVIETIKHIHKMTEVTEIEPPSEVTLITEVPLTTEAPKLRGRAQPDCFLDIAVGFDLPGWAGSENIFDGQQKLKLKLAEILQSITSTTDISCLSNSQPTISMAIYMQSKTGQIIFESKFANYSAETISNLMAIKTAEQIDLTVENLESLGKKLRERTSKAKVMLIFTDGLDDTKDVLEKASKSLREKGVHALITVSLQDPQYPGDLLSIEFGRGFEYKQGLSIEMEDIANVLQRQINAVVEKECCGCLCKCLGKPGAQGARGTKGLLGNQGAKGFPGHAGEEGEPGERGPAGPNGTRGIEGCSGFRGHKGISGYPGEKGMGGMDGINGITGEQGDYGVAGSSGENGSPGNPGKKGQKGDHGEVGKAGLPGDHGEFGNNNKFRGLKGHKGDMGFSGDPGKDGGPGKGGRAGRPGLPGHRGPSGKDGNNGKPGKRGHHGSQGFQGAQGPPGPAGPHGPNGTQGARGQQGLSGIPGEQGMEGIQGYKGQDGEPGDLGAKGVNGPIGRRGSMGQDGKDGFGPQGPKGRKGERGSQGIIGVKGEDGKAAQNGEQGPKGMKGNRGHAGDPGDVGESGQIGITGQKGPKGPPGLAIRPCDLISAVRESCSCCSKKRGACPAYPTELAFAVDSSADVSLALFERMKKIVINFLQDIDIAENNCPTGARVAVLTYNNEAKSFIRFSDFKKKQLLLKKIEGLGHERSSKKRNIGNIMQFVVRNVFKRVRNGALVRKIAVFLANGGSKDTNAIAAAASQFGASDVIPVIISFKDIPEVDQAFKVNGEATAKVVVLPRQQQESKKLLHRLFQCTLCFDMCEPNVLCLGHAGISPLPVNLDIAFIVDDLEPMESMYSETVKHFLNSMLNTFLSSAEPKAAELHPRVAIVQHSPNQRLRYGKDPYELEFEILDYTTKTLKKRHVRDSASQSEGSTGISNTIEWTLKNFFSNLTGQQTHKVIFTILSGEMNMDDKELLEISHKAKCKDFALLSLVLGKVSNTTILEEFVSFPVDQHLVYLDKPLETEVESAQRFAVTFLKNLAAGINRYPPPDIAKECKGIKPQETVKDVPQEPPNYLQLYQEPPNSLQLMVVMDDSETPKGYTNNYDACLLKQDEGLCHNYTIKWSYDAVKGCARFWYGGCGGNANRFDTKQECKTSCVQPSPL